MQRGYGSHAFTDALTQLVSISISRRHVATAMREFGGSTSGHGHHIGQPDDRPGVRLERPG